MEFNLLGPLEIVGENGLLVTPSRLKERVLLALLLVNAGQAVSAAEITDTLWGSTPPASAQANLYSYVASIRRGLQSGSAPGAARVRTAGAGYLLDAAPAEIDALRFERLTGDGTRLLHDNRPVDAVLRLEAALQLWRGRALMDLTTTPDIFKLEIARLDDLRLVALEHLTEARIEAGQADQAAVEAAALAQGHPTRERLWYLLMLARFRAGRQAEALAAYQQAYRALERELGLRPGDQLRELQQRILAGIPDTASKQTRLTPPDGDRPHQPLTSAALLVGRDRELELLTTWHAAATGPTFTGLPLLAVTGPPGVGKTALAVHWARSVSDCYPDGQILIDLRGYSTQAPTSTHEALTQLLVSLGVNTNDIPSEAHAATALYRSSISQRRVLIILDNAAHAGQVRELLPGTPGTLVLATSRNRLSGLVAADTATRLSIGELTTRESIAILGGIAGQHRIEENSAAAHELARLCNGLPLALRIAAANLHNNHYQGVADYARRVADDVHLRALSLEDDESFGVRSAFDLSYQRLSPPGQRAFRVLGLLKDRRFGVRLVANLLGDAPDQTQQALTELVAEHLVTREAEDRFAIDGLIRRYAVMRSRDASQPVRELRSVQNG